MNLKRIVGNSAECQIRIVPKEYLPPHFPFTQKIHETKINKTVFYEKKKITDRALT